MRRNKYNNRKTVVNGIKFDSQKESIRYLGLLNLQRSGIISKLQLQPKFYFTINGENVRYPNTKSGAKGREITYSADFEYIEDGKRVIEDCKGFRTDIYKLKKALIEAIHGITILET